MRLLELLAGLTILAALFTGTWPVAVLGRTARAPPAPKAGPIRHHHPPRRTPPPPPPPLSHRFYKERNGREEP
ncbi:hypothetical protein SETIT_9G195400v2 [Setaria italica]|uniref:Uncharacterized protein n=1 Tax=Setaria italica TaxID=4555 RepID=A0A368SIF3_SETIT|nr:hypothetical protein SETIT_9G195400v2 [Setaria italica]